MRPIKIPAHVAELIVFVGLLALPRQTRRGIQSHLRVLAKVIGRPPCQLPLDVALLRELVNKASPGAFGISRGYWASIVSSLWRALDLSGVKILRGTGLDLTADLGQLVLPIPRFPDLAELTPLLKFLIESKISPERFTQQMVPCFRDFLRQRYSKKSWQRAFKRAVKAWKRNQRNHPTTWPQHPIEIVFEERGYSFPWSQFPDLETEVDRMLSELVKPRSRRSGGKPILNVTTATARKGYIQRSASAAVRANLLRSESVSLTTLTDPPIVEGVVDYIAKHRGTDTTGNLYQLTRHINAIARHWVKRSKEEMQELINIRASVAPPNGPAEKNRRLLEKFRNPELCERFVRMPEKVITRLLRKKQLTDKERSTGMRALAAAVLNVAPLRVSELLVLQLGVTMFDRGQGRSRRVVVDIPADLVKNQVARQFEMPRRVVALIDKCRQHFLPPGSATSNTFLFPNSTLGHSSADHMSRKLADLTTDEIGVRMTAHQWRHVVGYIFLRNNPGCYETVRRFLGHKSIETTIAFYAFMLDDDAFEALDRTVNDLIDGPGRPPGGKRPRK